MRRVQTDSKIQYSSHPESNRNYNSHSSLEQQSILRNQLQLSRKELLSRKFLWITTMFLALFTFSICIIFVDKHVDLGISSNYQLDSKQCWKKFKKLKCQWDERIQQNEECFQLLKCSNEGQQERAIQWLQVVGGILACIFSAVLVSIRKKIKRLLERICIF